ncbi:hypothetical protein P152DRAFT_60560 [Eremomyces bilateralis CBS 781.70]|uniref:Protein NO VEIN C-terminal domain-containing protein n=1 Tax=Eremomyces bilateralis CBS 781.70 TaxID=1392243 RepID=A0A6G1G0F0_9PEZI|nr:uncharacterized protein P152DRAFT_60560 [Eremomyces bilateralis CBS 781.70]KAF1811585.1 hypothetical protein P152DRAFT_60560 [Eremomyces bilateralis CBS 781.70]
MSIPNREEANDLIRKLATAAGWISPKRREEAQKDFADLVAINDGLRQTACKCAEAISHNMHSNAIRFVYELVQNAEDSSYTTAAKIGEFPRLSLAVSASRIQIESNEDGFTDKDIEAICGIGQSTKKGKIGYVGEKGIGFKSVFGVSRKVHIESGHLSFSFEYNQGLPDAGLGMITPLLEPPSGLPPGVRTRIILYLNDEIDKDALLREFDELPDTLILFLKKLKQLSISIDRLNAPVKKTYRLVAKENEAHIIRTIGKETVHLKFLFARKKITDMPGEVARQGITSAMMRLAFPVSQDDIPIVEDQYTFAFLPLQKEGFKFLIQSDFVTQASRENAVDCPWNQRLLDEVVNVFLDAVPSLFHNRGPLKYSWVRYLGSKGVSGKFWARLQSQLFIRFTNRPCFIPLGDNGTRFASSLRLVPAALKDLSNQPLLSECNCSPAHVASRYVSTGYDYVLDIPILRRLGLETLSLREFVALLRCDLASKCNSRLRTTPAESQWHKLLSRSLLKAIDTSQELKSVLKELPLLPTLSSERWVSPSKGAIYFPDCGGIDVPRDLPLTLISPQTVIDGERRKLFRCLGVLECCPADIFPLLEEACKKVRWTLDNAVDHLKFMFWHHRDLPLYEKKKTKKIEVLVMSTDLAKSGLDPLTGWWYSPSIEDPCSAANVIRHPLPENLTRYVRFLHPRYYEVFGACGRRHEKTGVEWLEGFLHVKSIPQPRARGLESMSEEFKYLANAHPSLLRVLERHQADVAHDDAWKAEFMKIARIPIPYSDDLPPLTSTYLPLPGLKAIVERLGLQSRFRFIKELDGKEDEDLDQWRFLSNFGVQHQEDFYFWLLLLRKAREKKNPGYLAMAEIYSRLQYFGCGENCRLSLQVIFGTRGEVLDLSDKVKETLRDLSDRDYIFVREGKWALPSACRWTTPTWYRNRHNLSQLPGYASLRTLFVDYLQVQTEPDINDILSYIRALKSRGSLERITQILKLLYDRLHLLNREGDFTDTIRSHFKSEKLVYNFQNQAWYSPSSCIWAIGTMRLPEKFSVATEYSNQEFFFRIVLDVEEPNLALYIEALKWDAAGAPNRDSMKQLMRNVSQFSPTSSDLASLIDSKCFPVRYSHGALAWVSSRTDFAIIDREEYETLFRRHLTTLDFSKEEVHELEAFLVGFGLRVRYLSTTVTTQTTASRGSFDPTMTIRLSHRAYAICRYAAHARCAAVHNNPAACFEKLRNISVLTSEHFSKTLTTYQGDNPITVDSDKAFCHLEDGDEKDARAKNDWGTGFRQSIGLRVYIPSDPQLRARCLLTHLPQAILGHFKAPNSAIGEFGSIISALTLADVDEILDFAGVISLPGVNRPDDIDLDISQSDNNDVPMSQLPEHAEFLKPVASIRPDFISTNLGSGRLASQSNPGSLQNPTLTPPASISSPPAAEQDSLHYASLLGVIVDLARTKSEFPRVGNCLTVSDGHYLSKPEVDEAVSGTQRDSKVGAAGELFVYEWLMSFPLLGCDLDDWQSKIRDLVQPHGDYTAIKKWKHLETSDIVYEDHTGSLTFCLIKSGYLRSDVWSDKRPRYHIEVKATTSSLTTPLFVSRNQYKLMADCVLPENSASRKVYVLARVFNLGQLDMGMKLYVDPTRLEREGKLRFRVHKYEMTETSGT